MNIEKPSELAQGINIFPDHIIVMFDTPYANTELTCGSLLETPVGGVGYVYSLKKRVGKIFVSQYLGRVRLHEPRVAVVESSTTYNGEIYSSEILIVGHESTFIISVPTKESLDNDSLKNGA